MSAATLETTLDFIIRIAQETGQRSVRVTFHGGEPLMAGHSIFRQALNGLARRFGKGRCRIAVQSNLWLLDDDFCELFREHEVEIGTSLDGPESVTDAQRGLGYFSRTMQGIRRARAHGMSVGVIATITPRYMAHWREIFDFFIAQRMGFSFHAAIPPLNDSRSTEASDIFLSPAQYAALLRPMLDYYVEHRREIGISSLDEMCQGFGSGEGKVCTFRDCLGMFLVIDPHENIYSCQRFCGKPQHRLGALCDRPTLAALLSSPMARRLAGRQKQVGQACASCVHLGYCRGGCPYSAWASGKPDDVRDPYCVAYQEAFDYIQHRVAVEMASNENIDAIAERPWNGDGQRLLRKGPLIELVREGPHPSQIARTAKRIVAAVELAKGPDIPTASTRLVERGICRTQQSAEASLEHLWRKLHSPKVEFDSLYLRVTCGSQSRSTHACACNAKAHPVHQAVGGALTSLQNPQSATPDQHNFPTSGAADEISVSNLERLICDAKAAGFGKCVITGCDPLMHSQCDAMLEMLAKSRRSVSPMKLILHTNFALSLDEDVLRRIAAAFDQIVVIVHDDEQTGDARQDRNVHAATVRNLEAYATQFLAKPTAPCETAKISLDILMSVADIQSELGQSVRDVARRLDIRCVNFRPLPPLGKEPEWALPLPNEASGPHSDPKGQIENDFHPTSRCGIAQNLSIEPTGAVFVGTSGHPPHLYLGNANTNGLSAVLASMLFTELSQHSVDTDSQCRVCDVRYLCGGTGRNLRADVFQHDLDALPPECSDLRANAEALLATAADYLQIQSPRKGDTPCSGR